VAKPLDDPWVKARTGKPELCVYGCGKYATLAEPGTGRKAHKVCAEGDVGARASNSLGAWDGEDHKLAADVPLGCGSEGDEMIRGRVCGRNGGQLSCKLCPHSPTYEGPFA
jgi:hypothetical protein